MGIVRVDNQSPAKRFYWCIVIVEDPPREFEDGVRVKSDKSDRKAWEPENEFHYMLLCRTIAGNESSAHATIVKELKHLGTTKIIKVVTISTSLSKMTARERMRVQTLSIGEIMIQASYVAFRKGEKTSERNARKIIELAVMDHPHEVRQGRPK